MSNFDHLLRVAAENWARAYRARQAATSRKRETYAAARNGRHVFGLSEECDESEAVTKARAAERAAAKLLLAIVDPKPVTLDAKVRDVTGTPGGALPNLGRNV